MLLMPRVTMPLALTRQERRARLAHADSCMEEAALGVWLLTGLSVCLRVAALDVGFDVFPVDPLRAAITCALGWGVWRRRAWPAFILLADLVARTTARSVEAGLPAPTPAALVIGVLLARGLLASLDAEEVADQDLQHV